MDEQIILYFTTFTVLSSNLKIYLFHVYQFVDPIDKSYMAWRGQDYF